MKEVIFDVKVFNKKTHKHEHIFCKRITTKYFNGDVKEEIHFQGNPFSGSSNKFFKIAEKFIGNYKRRGISDDTSCDLFVYEFKLH